MEGLLTDNTVFSLGSDTPHREFQFFLEERGGEGRRGK
jgi:hypothetical protein